MSRAPAREKSPIPHANFPIKLTRVHSQAFRNGMRSTGPDRSPWQVVIGHGEVRSALLAGEARATCTRRYSLVTSISNSPGPVFFDVYVNDLPAFRTTPLPASRTPAPLSSS